MSKQTLSSLEALAFGGVFLGAFGLVHTWFWRHGQIIDWPTYRTYGQAILQDGRVPYRDFHVIYPPGALPVFILPALFSDYASVFGWLMAACGVALVAVLVPLRRTAAAYVAVSPVLVGSLILSRFDLWPALLATSAVAALVAGRHRLGWGLLGVAVAVKLWPLVLVPLALSWSRRHGRLRASTCGLATAAVAFAPFAVLAPHAIFETVREQAVRPLQIESLGASFLTTFGHPTVVTSHGSQNLSGHGDVEAITTAVQAAALLLLWLTFARGPATRGRFVRFAAACVCAFVAFSKVLSPQFLVWLVPLVPLVRGRRGAAALVLLTTALVLTQVWFPRNYWRYVFHNDFAQVVLNRNLVLVALLAVLAWPPATRVADTLPITDPQG
jgi:uncharacterized membrane protein